jgi:hypothetical protein
MWIDSSDNSMIFSVNHHEGQIIATGLRARAELDGATPRRRGRRPTPAPPPKPHRKRVPDWRLASCLWTRPPGPADWAGRGWSTATGCSTSPR